MSSTVLQLDPPLYLETPRGDALAYFLIDKGRDRDLIWVCFIEDTRECWCFRNPEIRRDRNWTMAIGRRFPLPVTHDAEPTNDPFKLGGNES
jgi:hypothetical protein